jgi:hypothetical protein
MGKFLYYGGEVKMVPVQGMRAVVGVTAYLHPFLTSPPYVPLYQ